MGLFVKNQENINASNGKNLSIFLNETIVVLSIFQIFLSATIPPLKFLQAPFEIVLIFLLGLGCSLIKLHRWHVWLFLLFLFVTLGGLIVSGTESFLVQAKTNAMGVFALIYFSQTPFRSKLVSPVFLITSLLLVLNFFNPDFVRPLIAVAFNTEYNLSRFGGVFLNTHFNAFFISIVLIYYALMRYSVGVIGLCMLYLTGSRFILVSYLAQLLAVLPIPSSLSKYRKIIFILALILFGLFFFLVVLNYSLILDYLDEAISEKRGNNISLMIILLQLADPAYYTLLLNPFPAPWQGYVESVNTPFTLIAYSHDGANEIGYFNLVNHCGIFLAVTYLIILLRNAKYYAVLILVSLSHNNLILSPLVVYMMIEYSRRITLLRDLKNA